MSVMVEIDPPTTSEAMELATIGPSQPSQSCTSETHDPVDPSSSERPDTSEEESVILCPENHLRLFPSERLYVDMSFHNLQQGIENVLRLWQENEKSWRDWVDFLRSFDKYWRHRTSTASIMRRVLRKVDILKRAVELYAENPEHFTNLTKGKMKDPLLTTDMYGRCALHHAVLNDQCYVVSWILHEWKSQHPREPYYPQISLEDRDGMTPLHAAVICLNVNVVKLLVENGAAVDVPNKHGVPPFLSFEMDLAFHFSEASENQSEWYYGVVKFMLEKSLIRNINFGHPTTGETMLHHAILHRSHKAVQYLVERGADPNLNPIRTNRASETNQFIPYRCDNRYFNQHMNEQTGFSALQYAAWYGDLMSVCILVNYGGNLAQPFPFSSNSIIDELCRRRDALVLGNFLMDLFDTQLRTENLGDNKVIVEYGILAPKAEPRQMAVVSALIRAMPPEGLHQILKHPLLQLYIIKQWSRFSIVLYSFLALYIIFVILLSWYTIHLVNNNSDPHKWLTVSMLAFAIILFLQNLLQFSAEPKWFLMQAETWPLFFSLTLSIAIAINGLHTSNASESWVLHVLSFVLPLSWIRLLGFFAKLVLPSWGHYALLLYIVLKNVLKVLSIGSVVVAGFSLSFFILFHNNDEFHNPWKAFAKTIVMMTGEYEYGDLFGTSDTKNSTDRNPIYDDLPLVTGRIVFIGFVIITSIVLMNLMTALAVIDVQALVSEGQLERSRKRAMFIAHWEHAVLWYSNVLTTILNYVNLTEMTPKCCLRRTRSESKDSSEDEIDEKVEIILPYNSRPSKIPKEVWREISTFYEKNKSDRLRSRVMRSDNTQVTFATIQASLESIKNQTQQLLQDRNADVQQAVPGCGVNLN